MELLSFFITLIVMFGQTLADQCFSFRGDGYLRFNILNFDNANEAHYSMKFSTVEPHGLLMYSQGQHGDEEALFVRDGRLVYHMFNTSPSGVEGYFGAFFQGDHIVNTGERVTVHVYRAYNVTDTAQRRSHLQTGLVYSIGGRTYTHVDHRPRHDITLRSNVYIGGYKESLSATVGNFTGQISTIREEKNDATFVNFSLNPGGHVSTTCIVDFRPV